MKNFSEKLNKLQESMGLEKTNFSEESVDIDVKDEASAREYGETLAKNIFGDKFDQKIFDGVFASALEECGENWEAVANYLKNCYTGSNKNFSEDFDDTIPEEDIKKFISTIQKNVRSDLRNSIKKHDPKSANSAFIESMNNSSYYLLGITMSDLFTEERWDTLDKISEISKDKSIPFDQNLLNKYNKNFSSPSMKNFCDRLAVLQESVGIEPTVQPTQTPASSTTPSELNDNKEEVTSTIVGNSQTADNPQVVNLSETPAVLEEKPKDTTSTPEEAKCPACGKKLILNFEALSDDEVNEIATEASEITKYPEQYETEADQIHAFCDWLQNSRFKDFCDEAIFKAFCGLKK